MDKLNPRVKFLLSQAQKKMHGFKFNIGMDVVLSKPDNNTKQIVVKIFHISTKKSETITNHGDIKKALKAQNRIIHQRIDRFTSNGSGWTLNEIQRHYLTLAKYKPLAARSYIPLPASIQNKKATTNIQNEDNKCFMYCLGRALDPNPEKDHCERWNKHLKKVCKDLGLEDIKMPVSIKDIPKIEKQFNVSINVFGHEDSYIYPIKVTTEDKDKHVDLLYTENEETSHYVLIKDFNTLNCKITKNKNKKYFCRWCINQHFSSQEILKKHIDICKKNGAQAVEMPKKNTKVCFSSPQKAIPCPFVIYADIEALLVSIKNNEQDPKNSYTINKHKHEACSIGYSVVCSENDKLSKPLKKFRGKDAISKFFEALFEEEKEIIEHMKRFKKSDIIMTYSM